MDLSNYKLPSRKKAPPHPLSACVELIKEEGIFKEDDKKYGRTYWLGVLSRYSKKKNKAPEAIYTHLLGLLKEGRTMDSKYNRGGWLTNKFSK